MASFANIKEKANAFQQSELFRQMTKLENKIFHSVFKSDNYQFSLKKEFISPSQQSEYSVILKQEKVEPIHYGSAPLWTPSSTISSRYAIYSPARAPLSVAFLTLLLDASFNS